MINEFIFSVILFKWRFLFSRSLEVICKEEFSSINICTLLTVLGTLEYSENWVLDTPVAALYAVNQVHRGTLLASFPLEGWEHWGQRGQEVDQGLKSNKGELGLKLREWITNHWVPSSLWLWEDRVHSQLLNRSILPPYCTSENQHFSQCPDHLQQCISERLFSSYVCFMQLVLVWEKDADHLSSYLPCQNWTVPAPCTQSLSENTKSHQEKAGTGCLSFPQTISVVLFDSKCLITFQIYF